MAERFTKQTPSERAFVGIAPRIDYAFAYDSILRSQFDAGRKMTEWCFFPGLKMFELLSDIYGLHAIHSESRQETPEALPD